MGRHASLRAYGRPGSSTAPTGPALRVIEGRRGVATEVVVRQTTLDDLLDEVTALSAEALELVDRALPLARRLRLMANAHGHDQRLIAQDLVDLLERQQRRHSPGRAA